MNKIKILIIILITICSINAGIIDGFYKWEKILDKFEFMPDFHLTADVGSFFLHKDSTYKSRYFIETNSDIELTLVGYKKKFYSLLSVYVRTGMGKQSELVIFDPRDVRYGVIPALKLKLDNINILFGLEHFCFHNIDRVDGVTEYWNKGFFDFTSPNFRLDKYRENLITKNRWDIPSRFSYFSRFGYYVLNGFGFFPESVISGGHDYHYEATFIGKFAFYKRLSWLVNLKVWSNLNYSRDGELYKSLSIGFENHFRRGKGGSMFYIDYYLVDELPVWPKDGLLEFGIRFYK